MFPSHRNYNGNNDPVHTDPSIYMTFFNDIMPNSKQEDGSFPFLHFQFDDYDDFPHELFQQQPLRADNSSTVSEILVNMVDSSNNEAYGLTNEYCSHNKIPNLGTQQISIRQRPAKKDRHSKINTAKGLRDRRMRLSLDVARQFFSLQDMLGYDKASKTVEWLLVQAEHEIKKLERARLPEMINYSYSIGAKSASSTSECEVVSGTDKATIRGRSINSKGKTSMKGNKIRQSRKFILRPLTRDMRDKARARARERTSKKKIMCSRDISEPKNNDSNQLWSWSSYENCDESGTRSPYKNLALAEVVAEVEEPPSHNQCELLGNHEHVADDSLVITGKWSPSSIFSYPYNIGSLQEHPFVDFQFFGKP